MAKHNGTCPSFTHTVARIYGVEDRITFLCGDYVEFATDYIQARTGASTSPARKWEGCHLKPIDMYVYENDSYFEEYSWYGNI